MNADGSGRPDVAAVVDRPDTNRCAAVPVLQEGVGPRRGSRRRVPGVATVGGDLDAGDQPPPESDAVPETVTTLPLRWAAPAAGELMVAVGPVVSADFVAATRFPAKVVGWAPMSASRLTCACCIRTSAAAPSCPSCSASSPTPTGRCRR